MSCYNLWCPVKQSRKSIWGVFEKAALEVYQPVIPMEDKKHRNSVSALREVPWMLVAPSLVALSLVLAWNLLGDSLNDVLNPRTRSIRIPTEIRQMQEISIIPFPAFPHQGGRDSMHNKEGECVVSQSG